MIVHPDYIAKFSRFGLFLYSSFPLKYYYKSRLYRAEYSLSI